MRLQILKMQDAGLIHQGAMLSNPGAGLIHVREWSRFTVLIISN